MDKLAIKAAWINTLLKQADAILLGVGAGFSASAGLVYSGPRFRECFADYIEKYHCADLYSLGFQPFPTQEEYWTYWARHVDFTRFSQPALPLYQRLAHLLADKNYFILNTNVDGQFEKAGFDMGRIFSVQGDYAEMQCAKACHPQVYSNEKILRTILEQREGMTVASRHLPRCPRCTGPMSMHLRVDATFVEDEAWHKAATAYRHFLGNHAKGRLVLLELGVGFNTPGIIRLPFEELIRANPQATLIRINRHEAEAPADIAQRCISVAADIGRVINLVDPVANTAFYEE